MPLTIRPGRTPPVTTGHGRTARARRDPPRARPRRQPADPPAPRHMRHPPHGVTILLVSFRYSPYRKGVSAMFSKPDDVAQHGSGRTGDDSPALRRLGRRVLDHKGAVITFWIAAAVVVTFLLPSLETVARDQATDPIPADVPSFQSLDAMGEAFDEPGASATVFAVLTNPGGFDAGRPDHDRLV